MDGIIEIIKEPWAWYISGPLIALIMLLLLLAGGQFGVSSTLRSMCAIGGGGKYSSFFDFDWKSQTWNLVFAGGAILGGFIASSFLSNGEALSISSNTINDLTQLGITFDGGMAPIEFFQWKSLGSIKGFLILIIGGFLVGFGARWAGGCTSGHAISGLSNLQLPSLIAVIGFFAGGLIMTHLIFPFIF